MTSQTRMREILEGLEIPNRVIKVYGSQITVECFSRSACEQFATVLGQFTKIRGILETTTDAKENRGTALVPSKVKVWRLYARA